MATIRLSNMDLALDTAPTSLKHIVMSVKGSFFLFSLCCWGGVPSVTKICGERSTHWSVSFRILIIQLTSLPQYSELCQCHRWMSGSVNRERHPRASSAMILRLPSRPFAASRHVHNRFFSKIIHHYRKKKPLV